MPYQGGFRTPRAARGLRAWSVIAALCAALLAGASPAIAAPAAPSPTSNEVSPSAPDPNPPLGGRDEAGQVVGGDQLISRGLLQAPGSPVLPDGISAASFVLCDLDTGQILAARDPHGRYQPASILKVLASLVLLPALPGAQPIVASASAAGAEGSAVGLVPGGTYTADQLFTAMMLMSGNDATMALAEAAGGADAVVARMNDTMTRLGAVDTEVQTPTGLDGWSQLTSAYDMALVLRQAVANPRLVAYDEQPTGELPAQNVAGKQYGPIPLANQGWQFFDGVPGAQLAKSGYTDAARSTYTAAVQRAGHRYGAVLLRSERTPLDQWQQAAALFDWAAALPAGVAGVGRLVDPTAPLTIDGPASPSSPSPSSPSPSSPSPGSPSPGPTPIASATGTTTAGIAAVSASPATPRRSRLSGALYAMGVAIGAVLIGGAVAARATRRSAARRAGYQR